MAAANSGQKWRFPSPPPVVAWSEVALPILTVIQPPQAQSKVSSPDSYILPGEKKVSDREARLELIPAPAPHQFPSALNQTGFFKAILFPVNQMPLKRLQGEGVAMGPVRKA